MVESLFGGINFAEVGIWIVLIMLVVSYIDTLTGMGFGLLLSPLLVALPVYSFYQEPEVIPSVLLLQGICGLFAAVLFFNQGIFGLSERSGNRHSLSCGASAAIFFAVAIIGSLVSNLLPDTVAAVCMGCVFLLLAVLVILAYRKNAFSTPVIVVSALMGIFAQGTGSVAIGAVATGGMMAAGAQAKRSVAVSALVKGVACLVLLLIYVLLNDTNFRMVPYALIGCIIGVPLGVATVRRMAEDRLVILIAISLGIYGIFEILSLL